MHDSRCVFGGDLHRGVRRTGRCAADQQRHGETGALHLAGDVDHLIKRWRDQAGKADQVRLQLPGRSEDLLARHHHAEVGDGVIIAG